MTIWKRHAQLGAALGILLGPALFAWAIERPHTPSSPETTAVTTTAPAKVVTPSNTLTAWSDAFANVAQTVRPSVVFIRADTKATVATRTPERRRGQGGGDANPFDQFFRQWERQNPGAPSPFGDPDDPSDGRPQRSSGTGFIMSPDGYIITNSHVVRGADRLMVRLFDGRTYSAKVVGRDGSTDVAVIKIDAKTLPAVAFGNSDSTRVGEWVLAIGNPMGEELSFTVTAGIVSAKGRPLSGLQTETRYGIQDFIQTDAAINPGNSGGPLVNAEGKVIGINSAIASQTGAYEGYGFAIPMNLARHVADELITHGKVTRAILGLTIRRVEPEDADYVKLDAVTGVVVQDFSGTDSPAKRAGVQAGDVVVAVDGQKVEYVAQFQQAVAFRKPGEEVTLTVRRKGGEEAKIKVRLTEAPSDDAVTARNTSTGSKTEQLYGQKLGIAVEPSDRNNDQQGLVVMSVDPDGPAADKLIPATSAPSGDIITEVNGSKVRTAEDLNQALRGTKAGEVVSLRVYNAGADQQRGGSRVVRMRVQ